MAACKDTEVGDVYTCESCGWTIEVTQACDCGCTEDVHCCGKPMVKK